MISLFLVLALQLSFAEEAEKPAESSRALIELNLLEKQASATAAKIAGKEASVASLIQQKKLQSDPDQVAETIKLLQQEHNELKKLIKEYDAQLTVLKYRFPERGSSFDRKYKRFSSKSLEQMEQAAGVEKYLHNSKKKVMKVYGVEQKKSEAQEKEQPRRKSITDPTVISK